MDTRMFEGFAHVWTPVELAHRVRSKPLAVSVAGERLVLFRDQDRRVAALIDRCPHRGVALSRGRVTPDGCIECPFHGWTFEGDGACRDVPLNTVAPAKRRRLEAIPVPVREIAGLIWIYTRPGVDAPTEPVLPAALTDDTMVHRAFVQTWRAHWTRAMENMIDVPHLPFVHRRTIGRVFRVHMKPDSVMAIDVEETATGLQVTAELDGSSKARTRLHFHRPNLMVLAVPVPRRTLQIHVWCVPIDANHTRMIVVTRRDFGRWNPLVRLFDEVNRLVIFEDRALVESSQPAEVPLPGDEQSVATDSATLAFRRYYLQTLASSSASQDGPPVRRLPLAPATAGPATPAAARPRSEALAASAPQDRRRDDCNR